jgi:hypothetical protein
MAVLTLTSGCHRRPPQITSAAPPVLGGPITVPFGTTLAFRIAQTIASSSSQPGQTFAAVVTRDVNDEKSQMVLPSGSPATLILLRGHDASTKKDILELGLASVTLNGDSYLVRNDSETGNPATPGARLGTFLGGVPGTWSGTGGLPSTGQRTEEPQPLTVSGERIWVPLGSLITFSLDRPVRLIGSHSQMRRF